MSIQLRDRYVPEVITSSNIIVYDTDDWNSVLNKCKNIIYLNLPGTYNINFPRRSGKTTLCAALMNSFNNCVMICRSTREEVRVRRDYGVKSPNCYNIYSSYTQIQGLTYDWLIADDLPEDKWTEISYYRGFGLTKYIRIGTNG